MDFMEYYGRQYKIFEPAAISAPQAMIIHSARPSVAANISCEAEQINSEIGISFVHDHCNSLPTATSYRL